MFNEPLASYNAARKLWLPSSAAYGWLAANMTVADKTEIDVESYDDFMASDINHRTRNVDLATLDKGYFEFMHPTRPDARRLLGVFCDPAREPERVNILGLSSPARFKFIGMRLAQHCYRTGNTADARAVIDAADGTLRRQSQSFNTTSKSREFLKRKPTRKELKLGVKLDSNGYVAELPGLHKLDEIGKIAAHEFTGGRTVTPGSGGSETILVISSLVSSIIGRAGQNLRKLEAESGARLTFSQTKDSLARQICTIFGPPWIRESARAAILAIVSEFDGRP